MGSRVTRVIGFFPANFQLIKPFRSRLRFRYGTDGQRDDSHQHLMPHAMGAGIIRIVLGVLIKIFAFALLPIEKQLF